MHIDGFKFMRNRFEVESAPAIAFVKDSGVKPVVVHGMSFFDFSYLVLVPIELCNVVSMLHSFN